MPNAIKQGDIAGAVVIVVKDGAVLVERGYGYADVDDETPMDPERTLVRPGSVSKLFTWTALMQLVEQGKVDLDARRQPVHRLQDPGPRRQAGHGAQHDDAHGWLRGDARSTCSARKATTMPGFDAILKERVPARIYAPGTMPAYSNYGVRAGRLHRAARLGHAVQRLRHAAHLRAARHDEHDVPAAAARRLEAAHGEGLRDTRRSQAAELRTGRSGAGGQRQHDGRGHGALHDRAPAGRQARRRADPEARDRAADARHADDDPAARQSHAARFLRVERTRVVA